MTSHDETSQEHKREFLVVVGGFALLAAIWCAAYMRLNDISLPTTAHDDQDHDHDH